jgi:hypothetical protein
MSSPEGSGCERPKGAGEGRGAPVSHAAWSGGLRLVRVGEGRGAPVSHAAWSGGLRLGEVCSFLRDPMPGSYLQALHNGDAPRQASIGIMKDEPSNKLPCLLV